MSSENAVFGADTVLKPKDFFFKVLTGSAQGILIGVLPSAILKYLLKYSGALNTHVGANLDAILNLFTILIPTLIGLEIAMQFKMKPLDVGIVTIAVTAASNSITWGKYYGTQVPVTGKKFVKGSTLFVTNGAGDVINAMIVAAIAVLVIWLVAKYLNGFGSTAIIFGPLLIGGLVGLLGKEIQPFVGLFTAWLGEMIELFTTLQPIPMSMLIAAAYAVIIVTPVSTVGLALAISLAGVGSAAAAIGVIATTVVLMINSWKVNEGGTTFAIFLGAMKGMMPSVFKKPVTLISFMVTGAISAILVPVFNAQGTPTTAGFGWIGFVSPIQAFAKDAMADAWMTNYISPLASLIVFFIVPIVVGFVVDFVFTNILKLYKPEDFKQKI